MRYFLKLSYSGAPFHGWKSQPNAKSVQSVIESALSTVLRAPVAIVGAGRTDTGVNARRMYAHFDAPEITDKGKFLLSLNRLCGPAVALEDLRMPDSMRLRGNTGISSVSANPLSSPPYPGILLPLSTQKR